MQLTFEHAIKTIKSITLDPLRPPIPHIGGSTNENGFDSLGGKIEPMPTLDLTFPPATYAFSSKITPTQLSQTRPTLPKHIPTPPHTRALLSSFPPQYH